MFNQNGKYIYITGRIRARETSMLNHVDLDRMINSPNAEESFRVLNNTDFSDNLLELPSGKVENFQKVLDEELHDVRSFLKNNVPDENILRYMALKYNFSNLKIMLKEKYFEGLAIDSSNGLASVDNKFLEECINYQASDFGEKRKKVALNDLKLVYHLAVKNVEKYFETNPKNKNPIFIDLIIDNHYFAELFRWTKFFKNKFIKDYIVTQIDLYNILTFLRLKRGDHDYSQLDFATIEGGKIGRDMFLSSFEKSLEHFGQELKRTIYGGKLEGGWNFYIKNDEFWMLERDIDNILVAMIKETKKISYGPEVAFSYLWGKHNSVRNIRIIMIAKINNIEPSEIKEKIRMLY